MARSRTKRVSVADARSAATKERSSIMLMPLGSANDRTQGLLALAIRTIVALDTSRADLPLFGCGFCLLALSFAPGFA
jgi:hypothetical protein